MVSVSGSQRPPGKSFSGNVSDSLALVSDSFLVAKLFHVEIFYSAQYYQVVVW